MADGRQIKYNKLVSTLNIDQLLLLMKHGLELEQGDDAVRRVKAVEEMQGAAEKGLVFSNTIVLGLGIRGALPPRIGDKCKRLSTRSPFRSDPLVQAGSTSPRTTRPSTVRQSFPTTRLKTAPAPQSASRRSSMPTPAFPLQTPTRPRKGLIGA